MYEDVLYKKPFLKEVIFRLDFPTPLLGIEKSLPTKVSNKILKRFPIAEPQKSQAQEFQFSGTDFQTSSKEITTWTFHGKERNKTLSIIPSTLTLSVKNYVNYELLIDDLRDILEEFFKSHKDLNASRMGLRYVNIIDLKGDNPMDWKDYINEGMLGIFDFHKDQTSLTRIFHVLEYGFEDLSVKFQFGIVNPDYPSRIKRKQFVLDIDAYFSGAFDYAEVIENIDSSHNKIQELFEKSITDETRTKMK